MKISFAQLESPVGPIAVAWRGRTVVALDMEEASERRSWETGYRAMGPMDRMVRRLEARFGRVGLERANTRAPVVDALEAYFEGDVDALSRVSVDPGGTDFQARVWAGLRRIPVGRTTTYGELAASVGSPGAARAAGGAVGANPIAIIIPCHRVLGSDRRLTGFGGGLPRKRWLLEHEKAPFRV